MVLYLRVEGSGFAGDLLHHFFEATSVRVVLDDWIVQCEIANWNALTIFLRNPRIQCDISLDNLKIACFNLPQVDDVKALQLPDAAGKFWLYYGQAPV